MKRYWLWGIIVLILLIIVFYFFSKSINEENSKEPKLLDGNWGYEFLKIDKIHENYKVKGNGVKIAIIDTGVSDDSRITNVIEGKNFILSEEPYLDDHGHGTHIYGIIAGKDIGIAPEADVYIAKALSSDLKGKIEDIIEAIDWSIEKNVDIILMPFGFFQENKKLENAINKALKKNIFVVSSVGNYGLKDNIDIMYPAKYSKVIAVGAIDKNGAIWKGTTNGEELDFLLPGQEISSYSLDGNFLIASGTSMASAYMAGFIALFIEFNSDLSKKELHGKLLKNSYNLDKIQNGGVLEIDKMLE